MPAKRGYTDETKAIMHRFFEAVDMIIAQKKIRGIQTYCNLTGIDRRHYYGQRKEIGRGWFQMSWMLPLIKEFGVSSDWILLGKGGMFTVRETRSELVSSQLDC